MAGLPGLILMRGKVMRNFCLITFMTIFFLSATTYASTTTMQCSASAIDNKKAMKVIEDEGVEFSLINTIWFEVEIDRCTNHNKSKIKNFKELGIKDVELQLDVIVDDGKITIVPIIQNKKLKVKATGTMAGDDFESSSSSVKLELKGHTYYLECGFLRDNIKL